MPSFVFWVIKVEEILYEERERERGGREGQSL